VNLKLCSLYSGSKLKNGGIEIIFRRPSGTINIKFVANTGKSSSEFDSDDD
jgi:hypothetical protein